MHADVVDPRPPSCFDVENGGGPSAPPAAGGAVPVIDAATTDDDDDDVGGSMSGRGASSHRGAAHARSGRDGRSNTGMGRGIARWYGSDGACRFDQVVDVAVVVGKLISCRLLPFGPGRPTPPPADPVRR